MITNKVCLPLSLPLIVPGEGSVLVGLFGFFFVSENKYYIFSGSGAGHSLGGQVLSCSSRQDAIIILIFKQTMFVITSLTVHTVEWTKCNSPRFLYVTLKLA